MPRQYPTGFWDEMVRRMLVGEPVSELVLESGVPMQTLHRWKHQAMADVGLAEGTDLTESSALLAAHKRIKALEQELQLVRTPQRFMIPWRWWTQKDAGRCGRTRNARPFSGWIQLVVATLRDYGGV